MADRPKCPPLGDPDNQWLFCPSVPGAIVGLTIFAAITIAHFAQAVVYRKRFCWVICMAATWETTSFVFRVLGTHDPRNSLYNTLSQILVILAPLWINAFAYMVMGRLIYYWLPSKALWGIRARKLTKIFVWLDVGTFFVQLVGGGMLSSDELSQVKFGMKIYMAGISLQQACVLVFFVLAIRFHIEVRRFGLSRPTSWKPQLYILYPVLILISIRIVYRLLEFSSGVEGYIPRHEGFFYALEATPMIIAAALFAIVHPGRSLTEPECEFTKLIVEKGHRRWWCCGRRTRTKIDPDFQSDDGSADTRGENVEISLPRYKVDVASERTGTRRHHSHHRHHHNGGRRHSRRESDREQLQEPFERV